MRELRWCFPRQDAPESASLDTRCTSSSGVRPFRVLIAAEDYRRYQEDLGDLATAFEVDIHSFVLMTNHVHLLVTLHKGQGASEMMRRLGQRYVQYINRSYRPSGLLWEGRFRSALVHAEA